MFCQVESLAAESSGHDQIKAYVAYGDSIWIEEEDGSQVSIYSLEQAKALRNWLTLAIGDHP